MVDNKGIHIPQDNLKSENFVGAENNQIPPTNPQLTKGPVINPQDLIDYEKERRLLFKCAFWVAIVIIFALYTGFAFWIFRQAMSYHIHDNVWHIAVILVVPPTTLLFLLLKVLSRQQSTESSGYSPLAEFGNQLLNVLREFLSKK
ncbi:hypothetical protein [Rodentibacter heidelbergensis]|uniref:Uncharacterized protein n=1 Tax=Rodentibacter heidelbergensis TaxID=1908258 RepID=A0A1V3I9Q7_9PAST|nr:hypothetical protein [Rodentibacter heidelbergensis]OOF36837.1 hypothetical protein BKK48_04540 [Rodentibacter heidelbergensis]